MADAANYLRAALGQGLGMGWGDEAEAWLRSKLGDADYATELERINREYGEFAQRNPVTSTMAEFGGGILPTVGAYLATPLTGGAAAPVAAATTARNVGLLARLAANPYARGIATGATTGAIAGAGSADPGERGTGALVGGTMGTIVGGGAPALIRGGGATLNWLRDRLLPSEETVTASAAGKINQALQESGLTPADIPGRVLADTSRGIPSTIANVDPALVDLAETVAQRSGPSGRIVEETLNRQGRGARRRVYEQARQGLGGGNYYDEEARLIQEMRDKSGPAYRAAYAVGEVDDPQIMNMLELPQYKSVWETARSIAETDAAAAQIRAMRSGQPFDPNEFKLRNIYSIQRDDMGRPIGVEITGTVPDVRTLDYMKRAMDAQITAGYKSDNAAVLANANAYKELRNALRDRTKEVVPEYAQALEDYKGDAEILDALRAGREFRNMDQEQIAKYVSELSPSELQMYKTGVVRDLYSMIAGPTSNANVARRIIGPEDFSEMAEKLKPMFDSPAQFDLFRAAMLRESQLFTQANRILGGAATGRRTQARQRFEQEPPVGAAVADAISGGFMNSLTNLAVRAARSATMPDAIAERVAKLLMSSDPVEVGAAVDLLNLYAQRAQTSARNLGLGEAGTIMGTTITAQPAPPGPAADISADIQSAPTPIGPSIEEDINAEEQR